MAQRQTQSAGDVFTANIQTGAVVGGLAFLVGYVVTFALTLVDGIRAGAEVSVWKLVGWVFYAAHNVQTAITVSGGGQSRTQTFDIFGQAQSAASGLTSTVPGIVYKVVPVVILLVAGYIVYSRVAGGSTDAASGAAAGATVVVGYLVLAIVGRFLFTLSETQQGANETLTQSVSPALTMTIILLGLAYPLIVGGIGGVLGSQ